MLQKSRIFYNENLVVIPQYHQELSQVMYFVVAICFLSEVSNADVVRVEESSRGTKIRQIQRLHVHFTKNGMGVLCKHIHYSLLSYIHIIICHAAQCVAFWRERGFV